jgi:hypothetical protein
LKLVVTHSGRLSAGVLEFVLEVCEEVGVVIGVVDSASAEFWTSITILAVVQPRIVEPISVYVYEKQEGYPGSVLDSHYQPSHRHYSSSLPLSLLHSQLE